MEGTTGKTRHPRTADTLPRLYLDWFMTPGRLVIGALLIGAIIGLVIHWARPQPEGVWFGIGIFVFGWIITAALTVRDRIKEHTFDLIFRTRFEEKSCSSSEQGYCHETAQ